MKVLAMCSVYEEDLQNVREIEDGEEMIDAVVNEFSWMHDSGIILNECHEINDLEANDEYQAYIWHTGKECYMPIGRSVGNKQLCVNRYKEQVSNLTYPKGCDPFKYKICKRAVYTACGNWEDV